MRLAPLLVLLLLATACHHRELRRENDGALRVEGSPFSVVPAANGELMPSGWKLAGFESKDGVLRQAQRSDRIDFTFERTVDDGKLQVHSVELSELERTQVLNDVARKRIRFLMNSSVSVRRTQVGLPPGFEMREIRGERPVHLAGAEGMDTVFDLLLPRNGNAFVRMLLVFARTPDGHLTTLAYSSPPSTFDAGLPAADDLAQRLRFRDEEKR